MLTEGEHRYRKDNSDYATFSICVTGVQETSDIRENIL